MSLADIEKRSGVFQCWYIHKITTGEKEVHPKLSGDTHTTHTQKVKEREIHPKKSPESSHTKMEHRNKILSFSLSLL